MIRRLRTAHRMAFMSLALILPVGVALAVISRPASRSAMRSGQGKLKEGLSSPGRTVPSFQGFTAFEVPPKSTTPFDVQLAFLEQNFPREWIAITPREDPGVADVLVYASFGPEPDPANSDLPQDVVLVESLNSTERIVCEWPQGATHLLFYSLAKARRIGSIPIAADASEEN